MIPLSKGTYTIFKDLENSGRLLDVNVLMIYPSRENFGKFIERYTKRGNSEIFMQYNHITQFDEWVELFDNDKSFDKYYIGSDEYLEDVLKKLNIPLISK